MQIRQFSTHLTANDYVRLVKEENKHFANINKYLKNEYDPTYPSCLNSITQYTDLKFQKIIRKATDQITFIKAGVNVKALHVDLRPKLNQIFIALGYNESVRAEKCSLMLDYLSRIKPFTDQNEDIDAYFEYVHTVIKRFVLSENTEWFEKLLTHFKTNAIPVYVKRGGKNEISIGAAYEMALYEENPHLMNPAIIDYLYHHNPAQFEKAAVAQNGIYKNGNRNTRANRIKEIIISVCDYKKMGFRVGELGQNIVIYLSPSFIIMAHEEGHLKRLLEGKFRSACRQPLPSLIEISYDDLEEYINIKLSKTSERTLSSLYGIPQNRLTHRGIYTYYTPLEWQSTFILATLEAGRNIPNVDMRLLNLKDIASIKKIYERKVNPIYTPLIPRIFYKEKLGDRDIYQFILNYIDNPHSIPHQKTPIHLLAELSLYWPDASEEDFEIKKKIFTYCLAKKIPIDQFDEDGRTALMYALMGRDTEFVELLLSKGAKEIYTRVSNHAMTHLVDIAISSRNLKMVKIVTRYMRENYHSIWQRILLSNDNNPLYASIYKNTPMIFYHFLQYYTPKDILRLNNYVTDTQQMLSYLIMRNLIWYSNDVVIRGFSNKLGQSDLEKIFLRPDKFGFLPIFSLFNQCTIENIQILKKYIDIAHCLNYPSALGFIIACDDITLMQYLLSQTNFRSREHTPHTLLHLLMSSHNCETIFEPCYEILKSKFNSDELVELWNEKDIIERTPLYIALDIRRQQFSGPSLGDEFLIDLLKTEALQSINTVSFEGLTPFIIATQYRSSVALSMLKIAYERLGPQFIENLLSTSFLYYGGKIKEIQKLMDLIRRYNLQEMENPIELKWSNFNNLSYLGTLNFDSIVFKKSDNMPKLYREKVKRNLYKMLDYEITFADTVGKLKETYEHLIRNAHYFKNSSKYNSGLFTIDEYEVLIKRIETKVRIIQEYTPNIMGLTCS